MCPTYTVQRTWVEKKLEVEKMGISGPIFFWEANARVHIVVRDLLKVAMRLAESTNRVL